jgi:hypothetical protein
MATGVGLIAGLAVWLGGPLAGVAVNLGGSLLGLVVLLQQADAAATLASD